MYMYTYRCIHICVYRYRILLHTHTYICTPIHTYIYIKISIYVYLYNHMCVYIYNTT